MSPVSVNVQSSLEIVGYFQLRTFLEIEEKQSMKKFQPVSLTHGDVGGNALGNYGHGDNHKGIPEQE